MVSLADFIGYAGAVVGTCVMLPQVIKTWRTKRVHDVSLVMLSLYFLNCVLWLVYGVLLNAMPIIVCNAIALVTTSAQLWMKFVYEKNGIQNPAA